MVIETMKKEHLSYKETARKFEISQGDKTVARRERIYLEEGKKGIYVERRGRACSADALDGIRFSIAPSTLLQLMFCMIL
jgi:hypothetical protein